MEFKQYAFILNRVSQNIQEIILRYSFYIIKNHIIYKYFTYLFNSNGNRINDSPKYHKGILLFFCSRINSYKEIKNYFDII